MDFNRLINNIFTALTSLILLYPALALAQPPEVQNIDGITFVSGGVGDESMAQLVDMEKQFDLKIFLVSTSGTYLSDVNVTVTDSYGNSRLQTASDGPVLLVNLPTGSYTVSAKKNGHIAEQVLNVTRGQFRTVYLRFPDE